MARVAVIFLVLLSLWFVEEEAAPVACPAFGAAGKSQARPLPRPRRQYERYWTRYERIDLDRILSSRRLVRNYVDCILDRKPCPPDGAELKKMIPDALHYNCSKCTQKQKISVEKAMERLSNDYKEEWILLLDRYDPDMSYRNRMQSKVVAEKSTLVRGP